MRFSLDQWIEDIKAKPEPVRMRYLVGCVACSMLLVVGVWALSVSQNFRSIANDGKNPISDAQGLLPKASNFSLDAFLSGEKNLQELKREVSGEAFFQQQLEKKETPNFNEDGYVPQNTSDEDEPTR